MNIITDSTQVFHPTFEVDSLTPKDELREIKELNKISSLADWSGMKQIVSPVLALTTVSSLNYFFTAFILIIFNIL